MSGKQKIWNKGEGQGEDEHRHRCLVRHVIRMRMQDRQRAHAWLNGGTDATGRNHKGWNELHPGSILERDVRDSKKPSREALMAEVAVLTELVRVLSAKVAELENKQ